MSPNKTEPGEFKGLLESFLNEFESYANTYFKKSRSHLKKYPKLIDKLYSDLAEISSGGKRMRGFLVYLGYIAAGRRNLRKILPISLAVEIMHTFLLIHDDIIDESDTRRGKMTIHRRYEKFFGEHYGLSQGVLIGDIACFEAFKLVNKSDFDAKTKIECEDRLCNVLLETAYGEALDVEYSHGKAKIADILTVADLKTARYSFVGPMTVGAVLAGVGSSKIRAIEDFGLKIGLAFQLRDDILGVFGDEKFLGKSTLSDMREGKNTLLIFKTRELASRKDLGLIDRLWGKRDANKGDLETIKKIIKSCGAYAWCTGEMGRFRDQAITNVNSISKDQKLRSVLVEMSDFIVTRRS